MYLPKTLAVLSHLVFAACSHHKARNALPPPAALPACRPADFIPTMNATDVPRRFGFVLYNATDPLDWLGPAEVLFALGRQYQIEFFYIAETLDIVTTQPGSPQAPGSNSSIWTRVAPTHTFADPPADLDVLVVPGGQGARTPSNATLDFVRATYPQRAKTLVTVCTGAMIAARAGLLDGLRATTNKAAWATATATGPLVHWQGEARWVVDGNVWTSSGVASGIDVMVAFVACHWGEQAATKALDYMEYMRHPDPAVDPFAVWPNGTYKYISS